jgi:hypothetical protein
MTVLFQNREKLFAEKYCLNCTLADLPIENPLIFKVRQLKFLFYFFLFFYKIGGIGSIIFSCISYVYFYFYSKRKLSVPESKKEYFVLVINAAVFSGFSAFFASFCGMQFEIDDNFYSNFKRTKNFKKTPLSFKLIILI